MSSLILANLAIVAQVPDAGAINYLWVVVGFVGLLGAVGGLVLVARLYRKVHQGQALIINRPKGTVVSFTGALVIPLLHRAEIMDISVKTVEVARGGNDGLICKDNIRADIRVTFFVRVNETERDVLRVAKMVGCARASDQNTIEELFGAKFSEALKTAGKGFEFEELYQARLEFKEMVIDTIGDDLNGYTLEDVAIDYLEQTSRDALDAQNILDAEGIRKITERTEAQRVHTNLLNNEAKKRIGKDNLEAKMAMFEYEKQEADAHARQRREIDAVRATQAAEAEVIKAKELAKQRMAQLAAEEEVNIRASNKRREEEMAEKDRERAVIVRTEEIEKERAKLVVEREAAVRVDRISAEKEVEAEMKQIAEIRSERKDVEKKEAIAEESIKDLRVKSEADRNKTAMIINAEAEAQQSLVVTIKAAEAQEEVAKFKARQRLVEAEAALDAADREAKAKIRQAEGTQAESAAAGLAAVRVLDAEAVVTEKQGMIEAKILKEKMQAKAAGEEEQGMVGVRLRHANAQAIEKEGAAKANATKSQLLAEAAGAEEKGLAEARVHEAEARVIRERGNAEAEIKESMASANEKEGFAQANIMRETMQAEAEGIEKRAMAEATGIREKLLAEAAGLAEKAESMKKMDGNVREHEEFRLRLEHQRILAMESMRTNIDVSRHQAEVYAEAFKAANINIVGGDESFYNNFLKSVSLGHSVDGFVSNSSTVQGLLGKFGMDGIIPPSEKDVPVAPTPENDEA